MENNQWEINYRNGKEINKYPMDDLVSFFFKTKKKYNYEKICEFGFGCGNNLNFLNKECCNTEIWGYEISKTAFNITKDKLKKSSNKINIFNNNYINNNLPKNYFDLVIDRGCFTHNPDYFIESIDIVYNILKDNGIFYTWLFINDNEYLNDGFEYSECCYNNFPLNHLWYNLPVIAPKFRNIERYFNNFTILNKNRYDVYFNNNKKYCFISLVIKKNKT